MQPQNVMKNMTTPTTIRTTAGSIRNESRTVSVKDEKTAHVFIPLLSVSMFLTLFPLDYVIVFDPLFTFFTLYFPT